MSILSSLLRDVAALFFPPRCPVCGRMLAQGEHTVCTLCRATGFWRQADNPVLGRCRDMLPVERASGLLYYVHGSGWRELIRGFKYRGAWRTARAMGEWYGRCLKESGLYDDVEVAPAATSRQALPPRVQPVRIHRRRDCRAAGRGGRPPQRAPETQYGEPGPQGAPRPGPQCRGCVRRRPSRAACGAARPAGGRRVHHGQHDAFVRRGDSALGARLPHQHRRARRLAARSGREGVGCGNYFSTGRTFPQGRCRAETML